MENNNKEVNNQKESNSQQDLDTFKTKLKEQEEIIKELKDYKLKTEQSKERKTLFKEFMINSDKQKAIGDYITKYNIKDQRGFIEDLSKLLDTENARKNKMADNYFNNYQSDINNNSLEEFAKRVSSN